VGCLGGRGGGGAAGGTTGRGIGVRGGFTFRLWLSRLGNWRVRRGRCFGFGPVGQGTGGGGTCQLHGEAGQFRADAQVARGAVGGFVRLAGRDGVQGFAASVSY